MPGPAWITLGAPILARIQTGVTITENLINYPIRKLKQEGPHR